jgi:hypothetical protein
MHAKTSAMLATAAMLVAAGCGSTGSQAPPKTGPKVHGTITKSLFVSGDREALRRVGAREVWCRWNDGQVELHVRFRNRMGAHVTVHLQPNYRLRNAGLHGDGVGSIQYIGIDAGAVRDWSNRLGSPDGVKGTPAISACAPEINSIDLG